jgi:hypothetical protein
LVFVSILSGGETSPAVAVVDGRWKVVGGGTGLGFRLDGGVVSEVEQLSCES